MKSLRMRIRDVVDAADRRLAQPEIYAELLKGGANAGLKVFTVTIAQMYGDKQLSRRKATKAVHAATGARFVYGPGRNLVEDREAPALRRKVVGFMAMKRLREARAAARRNRA